MHLPPLQTLLVHSDGPRHSTHAPPPSHLFGDTQVDTSGSPSSTLLQVPTLPTWLHVWQVPLQAVLQQTPSTQLPDWQALAPAHSAPRVSLGTHAPALQNAEATQSVSVPQIVRHAVAPHWKSPHEVLLCVPQAPAPSQLAVECAVPPLHDAAAQVVELLG
jgi:hypothetical protein